MLAFIQAGGWLMLPLLLCSLVALAIILERLWSLRYQRVIPPAVARLQAVAQQHQNFSLKRLRLAVQTAGSYEVHQLEKYLSPLGTIASVAPLLGLLGTVVGMIEVFQQLDLSAGNAENLAAGIALALITTATGLSIAIPSLIMHRYFLRRVGDLVVVLETQAQQLIEQLSPGAKQV